MAWWIIWIKTSTTSILWWLNRQQKQKPRSRSTSSLINRERLEARLSIVERQTRPLKIGISWKRCMTCKAINKTTMRMMISVMKMKKVMRLEKSAILNRKGQGLKRHLMAEFRRKTSEILTHRKMMMMPQMMMRVKKIVSRSLRKKRVSKRAPNVNRSSHKNCPFPINEICTT